MLYPQNADEIEIFITTRREGLLTKIGHDLRLRVAPSSFLIDEKQFSGTILVDDIEILGALVRGVVEPMSAGDRAKISKTMHKSVFDQKRYPSITFSGVFGADICLDLDIRRQKGSISLKHNKGKWIGSLDHRQFGIPQVKALLGTLKVNPILEIIVGLKA